MSILSCVLVTVSVAAILRIFAEGFLFFAPFSAEPDFYRFGKGEVRLFYTLTVAGSALICAANALYRHSAKAISALVAVYVLFFGRSYRLVMNGFVRAANKLLYAVLRTQGKVPKQYYLTYFDMPEVSAEKELFYFLYAAAFAAAFILAYIGVRRCSAFWFAALTLGSVSVPLVLNCFDSESTLVVLSVVCLVMYAVRVQGYRRSSVKNAVASFGNTLKIAGKYSSFAAFEQSMIFIVCSVVIFSVLNASSDLTRFERGAAAEELGKDIMYTAESIVSGTFFDELGIGTSNNLNNGRLSSLGDLEYTGKTMFEIKAKTSNPIYLRSFSSVQYTGRRWEQLSGRTLRSYDFWDTFAEEGYYPQFVQSQSSDEGIAVTIKNRGINHKYCLTDYRTVPSLSGDVTSKASCKYDGCFKFDRFGGESSYSQTIMKVLSLNHQVICLGEPARGEPGEALYEMLHNGVFVDYSEAASSFFDEGEDDTGEDNETLYRRFAAENYLSCPKNMEEWLPEDFDETVRGFYTESASDSGPTWGFDFDSYYRSTQDYIRSFLAESAEYTLEPGKTPARRDFTEYFLNENRKGYCVHFATAAVLMLRRAGIPARYCEGYIVTGEDLAFAKDDFTGIPDSNGHAWAEVYVPTQGWRAVEFTPGYSDGMKPEENKPDETDSDSAETDSDQSDTDTDSQTDTDSEQTDTETETDSEVTQQPEPTPPEETPGSSVQPKTPSRLVKFLLGALKVLLLLALIAAAYLALRFAVKRIRLMRFTRGDTKKAALAMYFFALRLMRLTGIKKQRGEGDEAFASRAARQIPGIDAKKLRLFTRTALSARFGRKPPERDECERMREFLSRLSAELTKPQPGWKKFIIKYVLFID